MGMWSSWCVLMFSLDNIYTRTSTVKFQDTECRLFALLYVIIAIALPIKAVELETDVVNVIFYIGRINAVQNTQTLLHSRVATVPRLNLRIRTWRAYLRGLLSCQPN